MENIMIREYESFNLQDILLLYESVGWINYTENPNMLMNAFNNSLKIIGAFDNDKLIGLIRIVGDGYSIIYIQDLLIIPKYQRRGIGKALLEKVLAEYKNVYQQVLIADDDPNTVSFYTNLGLKPNDKLGLWAFLKYNN